MKKISVILFFVTAILQAQYTIKGTMTPPEEGDWIILYKIEGTKQKFIKNSTITKEEITLKGKKQQAGKFNFELPQDAKTGSYRLTYRNRGAGFIDFLFNKENIELTFNPEFPEQSVTFTKSLENKIYQEYIEATAIVQKEIDDAEVKYITTKSKDEKETYKKVVRKLKDLQTLYEKKSEGMLANAFIKASKIDLPEIQETQEGRLNTIVDSFFNNIDFTSKKLYNSAFLIDKISVYIFFLRMAENKKVQTKLYKDSIKKVFKKVRANDFRKEVLEYLISAFTNKRDSEIVDELFATYYDKLPLDLQNLKFKADKLKLLTATVGRIAPDFTWKEDGKELKLSTLNDGENYLLVFWSTQCSHCAREIPELYNFMESQPKTSVVAYAIESNDIDFNSWAKNKLYKWHNAIGVHPESKWNIETVRKYNLLGTPTYFVLDRNKKIIFAPDTLDQLKEFFNSKK